MDPVAALAQLGGVAGLRQLLQLTTRRRLRQAVERGEINRPAHDLYRLAEADAALVIASEVGGVVSHLSAATLHGWEVAFPATCPWITVRPNAPVAKKDGMHLFWSDLTDEPGPVTSPARTVIDCARRLALGPALAVADSALRHRSVTSAELRVHADRVRGKGAAQARSVVRHASALADNPFESMLRAHAIEAGLEVAPQVPIPIRGLVVHPDVVDRRRRLVLEADSWEFHSGREAHARDCWRYTMLVVLGWRVLRFTWRQVMHEPDYVRSCLVAAREGPPGKENVA